VSSAWVVLGGSLVGSTARGLPWRPGDHPHQGHLRRPPDARPRRRGRRPPGEPGRATGRARGGRRSEKLRHDEARHDGRVRATP